MFSPVSVFMRLLTQTDVQENQELWDLMQQDEVAELDTSAALEGLDLASSIPPGAHGMSADTEQPYKPAASAATGVTEQGVHQPTIAHGPLTAV